VFLTRPDPPKRTDWALAGLTIGGPNAAVSGWDAVRLSNLQRSDPPPVPVLILVPEGRSRDVGEIHVRRASVPFSTRLTSIDDPELPLARIAGLPRAIADTALQYGALGPVRSLVSRAVQRQLCTVSQLQAELASVSRRGSLPLRTALAEVAEGARSVAEARAVAQLKAAQVPAFELNVPLIGFTGEVIAIADIFWRSLRAVLEIDSAEYHFLRDDWQATLRRHNLLTRAGLALTHYPPSATADGRWLVEVVAWLRQRATELAVPYVPDGRVFTSTPDAFVLTEWTPC
jgi:hypothetical protein